MMRLRPAIRFAACLLAALLAAARAAPASADVSLDAGGFLSKGTLTGGGSLSVGLLQAPSLPIKADATLADAGGGKGYAATVDARLAPGGTAFGAGIGLGNLGLPGAAKILYEAILARSLAPHVAIEGRMYLGPNRPSSLFAGLRLTF